MLVLTLFIGIWRGIFSFPGQELPVNFEMKQDGDSLVMILHNAEERISCRDILRTADSLFIKLPMYDSEFRLKYKDQHMEGIWINHARKDSPSLPFKAVAGDSIRFKSSGKALIDVSGKWSAWFDAGTKDSSYAIGQFRQTGNKVTGTFLTESGDHRYLEGIAEGDSLKLSVFDGFFCRLYLARIKGDRLEGDFFSGNHHRSNFTARRDPNATLPDASLRTTFSGIPAVSFPDVDSNIVNLKDTRFKNKVVILQIMGTWCPNCMDESEFLSEYYNTNKNRGVEIIGIAFERTSEFKKAAYYLGRVAERFNITYPLVYAGTTAGGNVEKALPGLKGFFSYPTTIFINRKGEVAHVHAGFNGPASGEDYETYKKDFYQRMHQLLNQR